LALLPKRLGILGPVSHHNRQVVTGLVGYEKIQPPKYKRRQIRAAFHNASLKEKITAKDFNQLQGYYGYLSAIYKLDSAKTMVEYREILTKLSQKRID
jgi:hypothetical protein